MLTEDKVVAFEGGCSALAKELRDSVRVRNESAAAKAALTAAQEAVAVADGKVDSEDAQTVAALDNLTSILNGLRDDLIGPSA